MSRLRFCMLLAVLYSCSELGHSEGLPPVEIITIPTPQLPTNTTTSVVSTSHPDTTTSHPETTTSHPDTTTSSTTTTPKPTTTTPKPTTTTTPPTTSTTTPSTTSTTTPAPTPAPSPAPGPLPPPTQGNWSYKDPTTNVTCILLQFAAQLNVTYSRLVDNTSSLWHVQINVPSNATQSGGSCDGDQRITLSWLTTPDSAQTNNMTFVYHKNDTNKNYVLKSLNVSLTPDNFVNGSSKVPLEFWNGPEWQTPLERSYRCATATQLNMTNDSGNVATLTVSHLQEEAYRTVPSGDFSAARECSTGDVPDAVPIAVGCALGALIVVMLAGYLVARRRSAARGYLSM